MTALASAAKPLALELHDALRALDPARWRAEKVEELRRSLASLRARFAPLAQRRASKEEEGVRQSVEAVSEGLREKLPQTSEVDKWVAFRARVSPAYEALVTALKAQDVRVPSLRPTNYTRSLFHALNGLATLAVVELMPAHLFLIPTTCALLVVWGLEGTRRISPAWNDRIMRLFGPVSHPYEQHTINSGTWYVSAMFVLALMQAPLLAAVAVSILAFADPAAALVGRKFGSISLVNGRSLQGTVAFMAVGAVVALAVITLLHGELSIGRALLVASFAAVAGGIAELFSSRIDDNLSIPLVSAAAAYLALLV
ncbi:MAG: dolichol kinase [Polyangiales bacterium]|jgi:dolichol kinase